MANEQFNLDAPEELWFQLEVRGNTSDPNHTKPTLRFVISEKEGGMGITLPVLPKEDGWVMVQIPPMKEVFSENKVYDGKLEMLIGNKYFVPSSINMEFIKEYDVKATYKVVRRSPESVAAVKKVPAQALQEEPTDTNDLDLNSFILSDKPARPTKVTKTPSRPEDARLAAKAVFAERSGGSPSLAGRGLQKPGTGTNVTTSPKPRPKLELTDEGAVPLSPTQVKLKNKLKNMLGE